MNRIQERFRDTAERGRASLVPYFTAAFPDASATKALIRRADEFGASVVEIGLPFSDSIADGPVIQDSFHFCLANGYRTEDTFRMVSEVRPDVACGLVAMVSYSVVHRFGLDAFMRRSAEAGFDGVILPDVPLEEASSTAEAAAGAGLCHIGLIAPSTPVPRARSIAQASTGFIYRIAVAGTTGERASLPAGLRDDVAELRRSSGLPVCVGFGISTAAQVREVCTFADGAIVGSAIVRRIRDAMHSGQNSVSLVDSVSAFIGELMQGLDLRDGYVETQHLP